MSEVIAICCADIHLSHRPPVARSAEPDWYEAMTRPLWEIKDLQQEYEVPVLCAGDVFDKWNSPAELINFAIENLPVMYAVAGQHDLPNHNMDEVKKSVFWTLRLVGTIIPVGTMIPGVDSGGLIGKGCVCNGFSWSQDIESRKRVTSDVLSVTLIHDYLWSDTFGGYPGAPEEKKAENRIKQLQGYDVAIFGDNHVPGEYDHLVGYDVTKPSSEVNKSVRMFNCGSLMRRTIDQIDHKPSVGLVKSDGTIERHYLDCSQDKFIEDEIIELANDDERVSQFIKSLDESDVDSLDFREMVNKYLRDMKVESKTKKILEEVMQEVIR